MKKILLPIATLVLLSTKGIGQANTTLSNLSSLTSINATLKPGKSSVISLGSSSKLWKHGYFSGNLSAGNLMAGFVSDVPIGVNGIGTDAGIHGYSKKGDGVNGVSGYIGVYGAGDSKGVYGFSQKGNGVNGVSRNIGVYGEGGTTGVYGHSQKGEGVKGVSGNIGVYGDGDSTGVYAKSSRGGKGVIARGGQYGVYSTSDSVGIYGSGPRGGVYGFTGTGYGVEGYSIAGTGISGTSFTGIGVYGTSSQGTAIYGASEQRTAIIGNSGKSTGVAGSSAKGAGVRGSSGDYYGGVFSSSKSHGIFASTSSVQLSAYAGFFQGNVYATGTYNTSDKRLKKNIEDFSNALSIINKLKPKYYEFRDDGKFASFNLPKGNHYGLLAQDLEEILPYLVREAPLEVNDLNQEIIIPLPDGKVDAAAEQKSLEENKTREIMNIKAVNYTEIIPILIKGMQELNSQKDKQIADLQNQINELKSLILKGDKGVVVNSDGYLKQNVPNPSSDDIMIRYYVPNNAAGKIVVTDSKGSTIKTYNASRGEGQLNISSGTLPSGTYNYTLYINDKIADSKQMVIVK